MTVDYSFTFYREAFWSVDGQQWRPIQTIVGLSITHGIPWKKGLVQPEAIADVGKFVAAQSGYSLNSGSRDCE